MSVAVYYSYYFFTAASHQENKTAKPATVNTDKNTEQLNTNIKDNEFFSKQAQLLETTMSTGGGSVSQSNYYTIALLGKTGMGKSTTGNKLLQITNTSTQWCIKDWRCHDLKHYNGEEPKMFESADTIESVTKQCQMLSNEQTKIRVLDIPGFADSEESELTTVERNAGLIDSILNIQEELNVSISRILYFLPIRGHLERADAYFKDEMRTLYYYFGVDIFNCMIIVTTRHKDDSSAAATVVSERTCQVIERTIKDITTNQHLVCPRVVCIPFNASPEQVLHIVQSTPTVCELRAKSKFLEYSNPEQFESWIKNFELAASQRSLNDSAKVQMLKNLLTGSAKTKLDKLQATYELAKNELQKHIYLEMYDNRKKRQDEEWKDFGCALHILAHKAFPDEEHDKIEVRVLNKIKDQAHLCIRYLDFDDDLSLDSVITIVSARQAIPVYTGDDKGDDWQHWVQNFDTITDQKHLDEQSKVQWLKACLAGKALENFLKVSENKLGGHPLNMKISCERFYFYLFYKHSSQRWDHYAYKLKALAEKWFPSLDIKIRDEILRGHILSQVTISPDILEHLKSLDEIITFLAASSEIPNAYADDTGETWNDWLIKFEDKCGKDNPQKLQWLKYRISDNLLPLFEFVCKAKGDYNVAFGEALKSKAKFKARKKKPNEDWQALCTDLCSLANQHLPQSQQNAAILKQLLSIIEDNSISLPQTPNTYQDALSMLHVIRKIGKYSGENIWEDWLNQFESALALEKVTLTDNGKIMLLKGCLEPKALLLFPLLLSDAKCTYKQVTKDYEIKLHQERFKLLKRDICKSWKEFADRLSTTAKKAFSSDEVEKKVLEHFLADPLMTNEVREKNLQNIEAAVMIIEGTQSVYNDKSGISWQHWLDDFEKKRCGVKDVAALQCMKSFISKDLIKLFETVCSMTSDYVKVTTEFHKSLSKEAFNCRGKVNGESWEALANDLCLLAKGFVSDEQQCNDTVVDQLVKLHKKKLLITSRTVENTVAEISLNDIEMFSVDANWESWLQKFESVFSSKCTLTDVEKILLLRNHMSGDALKLSDSFEKAKTNYIIAKVTFEIDFYKHRFATLKKVDYTSWEKFEDDLNIFVTKAYPGIDTVEMKRKVLHQFIAGNKQIIELQPESIAEAKNIIDAIEKITCIYSGENYVLDSWIEYFERMVNIRTPKVLCSCLSDAPRNKLKEEILQKKHSIYDSAKCMLYKHKLELLRRDKYDSWKDFATALYSMADKASPYCIKADEKNETVLRLFLAGSPDDVQESHPNTIEEAIDINCARDRMKEYKYPGKVSYTLDSWIVWFEQEVALLNINPTHKVVFVLLTGNPREMLKCQLGTISTYDNAKCLLYQELFISLQKSKYNSSDDFAKDLITVATKAYPNQALREKKLLEHFLADYPYCKQFQPNTMDGAMVIIHAIENRNKDDEKLKSWIDSMEDQFVSQNIPLTSNLLFAIIPDYYQEEMKRKGYSEKELTYEGWKIQLGIGALKTDACRKCTGKSDDNGLNVIYKRKKKNSIIDVSVPFSDSKCHAEITRDRYSKSEKVLGTIAHIATFGLAYFYEKVSGNESWGGWNNTEKVCCDCRQKAGCEGCQKVHTDIVIDGQQTRVKHTFEV